MHECMCKHTESQILYVTTEDGPPGCDDMVMYTVSGPFLAPWVHRPPPDRITCCCPLQQQPGLVQVMLFDLGNFCFRLKSEVRARK